MSLVLASSVSALEGARPIAVVRGDDGALRGHVLGVRDALAESPTRRKPSASLLGGKLRAAGVHAGARTTRDLLAAAAAVDLHAEAELDDEGERAFALAKETLSGPRRAREVTLPAFAHFEPIPTTVPSDRDVIYVASPAGGGKTVYISQWALKYRRLWPDRKVFIASANTVADDPAWLALPPASRPLQIDVATIFSEAVDVATAFPGACLVILDDLIDAKDGKQAKAVLRFAQDLLQIGRRHGLSVLITSHELTSYSRTRAILHDCHSVVVFPHHTPRHSLSYFMRKLFGGDAELPRLKAWGSRWVQLSVRSPQWALGEHQACTIE